MANEGAGVSDTRVAEVSPADEATSADAGDGDEPLGRPVVRAILERRSQREFTPTPVPPRFLETIVACGCAAPSSKRAEPWRFHVIDKPRVLKEIAAEAASAPMRDEYVPLDPKTGFPRTNWESTVVESAGVLSGAAAAIFVENRGTFSKGTYERSEMTELGFKTGRDVLIETIRQGRIGSLVGYSFEVLGLGGAIQNMILAANALGLGCTFMGDILIVEDLVKEKLNDLATSGIGRRTGRHGSPLRGRLRRRPRPRQPQGAATPSTHGRRAQRARARRVVRRRPAVAPSPVDQRRRPAA